MKKLASVLFVAFFVYSELFAQIKISDQPSGTTVDANAVLELESNTKALLLPRLTTMQIQAMENVPAGMLVYSSTDDVLYIRTNTGWTTLALAANAASATNPWSTTGITIYATNNRVGIGTSAPSAQLANTEGNTLGSDGYGGGPKSFSWAGTQFGYIGQFHNDGPLSGQNGLAVKIASPSSTAFDVSQGTQSEKGTPLLIVKSNGNVGIGTNAPAFMLDVAGTVNAASYKGNGAMLTGVVLGKNPVFTGKVGVGIASAQEALDVNGNIAYSGDLHMGIQYVNHDNEVPASFFGYVSYGCPTGTKLIGGGGGMRDSNVAQADFKIQYSGPDQDDPTKWRIVFTNSNAYVIALRVYTICAKVQ